jgi:hypothetical protein
MDILAQRKKVGNLTGKLLLNGRPAAQGSVVRCAAYVPQVGEWKRNEVEQLTCHSLVNGNGMKWKNSAGRVSAQISEEVPKCTSPESP